MNVYERKNSLTKHRRKLIVKFLKKDLKFKGNLDKLLNARLPVLGFMTPIEYANNPGRLLILKGILSRMYK